MKNIEIRTKKNEKIINELVIKYAKIEGIKTPNESPPDQLKIKLMPEKNILVISFTLTI